MENQLPQKHRQKKIIQYRKDDLKWIFIIFYIVIAICSYFIHLKRKQITETSKLRFNNVNIEYVENGTYIGKCQTSFLTIEVEVSVLNHKICQIEVLQNKGTISFKPEELINQIIDQNKVIVSVIKHYELQSIVFINAVDNALYNALNPEIE